MDAPEPPPQRTISKMKERGRNQLGGEPKKTMKIFCYYMCSNS